jgi:hypothetical protein
VSYAEYGLIVSFPDESESFVLGFEAGQIWDAMGRGDPVEKTVHRLNEVVLLRMARAQGYDWNWTDLGDGCWAEIKAQKARLSRPSGDPIATGRLAVITGGLSDKDTKHGK